MWFKKAVPEKTNLKSLDLESLRILQGGLLENLVLINKQIIELCSAWADLSKELPKSKEQTEMFAMAIKETRGLNIILEHVLSTELGKVIK